MVVIVGCFGLASNILGLFLFHGPSPVIKQTNSLTLIIEHGHSHDDGGEGHSHSHEATKLPTPAAAITNGEREPLLINRSTTPPTSPPTMARSPPGRKRTDSIDSVSLFGHPIQNRAKVIATAQDIATSYGRTVSPPPSPTLVRSHSIVSDTAVVEEEDEDEHDGTITPLAPVHRASLSAHSQGRKPPVQVDIESRRQQGHSHGNMNMRALLLHVLGDALGNVGVISSGLIIWQTTWSWKYYSDPMISLLITIIIFSSALPLVKSASYILLQGGLISTLTLGVLINCSVFLGVPEDIKLDDLRIDIGNVEGVASVHELHVWQLSETRHIASVHIRLEQKADYMRVVHDIRKILHKCDIHNATIQPEFGNLTPLEGLEPMGSCLVACPPGTCDAGQICCRE